jgi:hypothetical protein
METPRVRDLAAKYLLKRNNMQLPSMLRREPLKRLLQGATAGAIAGIAVGFYWGGWSVGNTADKIAARRSERAVVAAMAPVCNDAFRALPDAEAKKVTLLNCQQVDASAAESPR